MKAKTTLSDLIPTESSGISPEVPEALKVNSDSTVLKVVPNSIGLKVNSDSSAFKAIPDFVGATVHERINRVMADVGYVKQTGWNSFQNYKYTSEYDLIMAVRDSLVEHGLVMYPVYFQKIDQRGDSTDALVTYRLAASDNADFVDVTVFASGADKTDKGAYKLMTGALKYVIRQTFLLPSTEDDPEATDTEGNKTYQETERNIVKVINYARSKNINLFSASFKVVWKDLGLNINELEDTGKDRKIVMSIRDMVREIAGGAEESDAVANFYEKYRELL